MAAGGSHRYGGPKLLTRLGRVSLLRHATQAALAARPAGCTVVLGARAAAMRRELRGLPVRVVVNRRWRGGLSSSLRAGLRTVPASCPAAMILLADQPSVDPACLLRLLRRWRRAPASIAAAWNGSALGPPCILPRSSFPQLQRLRGDTGARQLIARRRARVTSVQMPEAALDIDRPDELERYVNQFRPSEQPKLSAHEAPMHPKCLA